MPTIKKKAEVPFSPEQMFRLVDDVTHYPEFIPWCVDSQELTRNPDEVRASLTFAKGGLSKSFTTCNRLSPYKMIEIRLINGPFKQLEGFWQFESLPANAGCLVQLFLEYEFSSIWLAGMFGPIFHQVADRLVTVFCDRAQQLYGKNL